MYVSRVLIYGCISLSKENIFTSMRDRTNRPYLNKIFFNQQRYILLWLKSTGQHNDLEDALALDSCISCNISVSLQVVVLALQPEPLQFSF